MQVPCPKCGAQVAIAPVDAAAPGKLNAVTCSACGQEFDARASMPAGTDSQFPNSRKLVSVPAEPVVLGPEAQATSAGAALEPMSLEDAAAEFAKHKIGPIEDKPARHLPKKIGAYDVLAEINRGGMGVVYKAIDPQLRRLVAIKVLLAGEGAKDDDLKRFKREAQATARLQHPNIVQIYAVGEHEGKPYLVMDFIEGKTAKQLKEEGKITPRLALSIIEGVAEGLHHAHLHGVVHRDVKPANIIVDLNERAQLMDFGLARRIDEDLEVTQSGTTMGTPSYMAPEQAEGRLTEVDGQSDVYSAGACLYELLTGVPPFEALTVMATLRKVLEESPLPPRRLNPRIHRDVETICLKCLEKSKKNRYGSALQLAEDIRRFNAGEAISAKPLGPLAWYWRKAWRHREVSLVLLAVIFTALAALLYSFNQARRAARAQLAERQQTLHNTLSEGQKLFNQARESLLALNGAGPGDFQQNAARARAQIEHASAAFRQAQGLAADNPVAKLALDALKKLENQLEVERFIHKARMFLYPPQGPPGDAAAPPNYAGAEFAAQEAVDRDPENAEARELLHAAIGIRAVSIETSGDAAEVFARRIADGAGRQLPGEAGLGQLLGRTPVNGRELEPGLYLISFQRAALPLQQATLAVTRDARQEDLRLRVTVNASEENMVLIPAGNVTLPQLGVVSLPAYAIDRFEFPNKAGTVPLTGLTLLEAQNHCKQLGKTLCSSAQWLRACMGDEERRYPYGRAYLSQTCATGFDFEAQKRPLPSGLFARCRTPEGVYDMSGNVAEWTESSQEEKIFGGDWTSPTRFADLTVSCRARSLPEEVNTDRLGFRCCKAK